MKRTQFKRKNKSVITKTQDKLWELCKQITRLEHPHICYTCNISGLSGSNLQTGHMLAKASLGAYLKYDLRLLRPQCLTCNIHRGGMGAIFIENMRKVEGNVYVDQVLKDRNVTVKALTHYQSLILLYEKRLKNLQNI